MHVLWSVIFQRVYNFPYEEDCAGVFIQNHQEKGPVESDSRRVRKIARSPGNLLHCRPRCFSAILMNIQHGFVDHLQGHKAKQLPADNPARIEQPVTLLALAEGSPVWGKTRQHQPLGRASPALPLPPQRDQPSAHSCSPPSLRVQRVTLKQQTAKEHSR